MAHVLVVTSGKGGVGKTTSTAALGAALARGGDRVAVIDFDVGLRNLDLLMGAERRVVYDLIHVVQGTAKLSQALIRDKRIDTLFLLAASQTRDKDSLTEEGVERVVGELRPFFDWVICDSPAGIERGASLAMRHANSAIVVANPEVSSVRDSDRIIGLLEFDHRQGQARRADGEVFASDAVRPNSRGARRDAWGRGCARHSLHSAARDHSRKQGNLERLEHGNTGYLEQPNERSGARLSRRRPQAQRRDGAPGHTERQERTAQQAVWAEGGMRFLNLFGRQRSASTAQQRLQVLLMHERNAPGNADLIPILREDILAAIGKHIPVDSDRVQVRVERGDAVSLLEIDIEISSLAQHLLQRRPTPFDLRPGPR